eukprot:1266751-Rhodomonas_salina.4
MSARRLLKFGGDNDAYIDGDAVLPVLLKERRARCLSHHADAASEPGIKDHTRGVRVGTLKRSKRTVESCSTTNAMFHANWAHTAQNLSCSCWFTHSHQLRDPTPETPDQIRRPHTTDPTFETLDPRPETLDLRPQLRDPEP